MTTTAYEVKCLRHGVLYAWTWTKGDPYLLANWVALHKKLAAHDSPPCWLRFTSKEVKQE